MMLTKIFKLLARLCSENLKLIWDSIPKREKEFLIQIQKLWNLSFLFLVSLHVEQLLIVNANFLHPLVFKTFYLNQVQTTSTTSLIKLTGFLLSLLMIKSMIAGYLMNGSNSVQMLMKTLAQFQVLDSSKMRISLQSGVQSLFIIGMLKEKSTVDSGI